MKLSLFILMIAALCAVGASGVAAQDSGSVLYVPLVGITSVPEPLALPKGAGLVTYRYAVKNFLKEVAATDIRVVDDSCSPVIFTGGDDNVDDKLDASETWRYACTTRLATTTRSTATVTGSANNIAASHSAHATVVVGTDAPAPLVSVINITKVAYPLSLPVNGGAITFTYRVTNPGTMPLEQVEVTDNTCSSMSGKLGDTNGNMRLDTGEVWIYRCTTHLTETTTNTVRVTAFANGLQAVGEATIIVTVETPSASTTPGFPETGTPFNFRIIIWLALASVAAILVLFLAAPQERVLDAPRMNLHPYDSGRKRKHLKTLLLAAAIVTLSLGTIGGIQHIRPAAGLGHGTLAKNISNEGFGWKFPVTKFPSTGSGGSLAYSDIRDPGGIPQGLPVRLKIPDIGVDSAIEDALVTPDGRMDVPAGSENVAWFALGPHPGEVGSAVIGGHFGITNGVPFVFYKLDQVAVGDKIYIEDDKGDTLAFVVRSIKLFNRDDDATTVFTSEDGLAHLNLITCEGIWNKINDTYPERRVVFADALPAEDTGPSITSAFSRSLAVGAQGADVAALQTILTQKGFLTMPVGVASGFFGTRTRVAVASYQTSVGLPSVGVFGPQTKAKLRAEALSPVVDGKTLLPTTALAPPAPQDFVQVVESLFATPLDGFVTLVLLLSICALVIMHIRRRYVR